MPTSKLYVTRAHCASLFSVKWYCALPIVSLLAAIAAPALANDEQALITAPDNFDQCLAEIGDRASQQGVARSTIDQVFAGIEFLPRVIELDRRQPEFTTTFADYLGRRVNEQRINRGRELLEEHRELLARVTRETGVPPAYLMSFWGLETNFGSYFGRMSVPSALATLACDPRRATYFSGELISALKIIDEGAIAPERMEGSWAGAMGHVQFMPSVFLQHAVDADGDGRRDLWNSLPDAMMSAGRFLQSMGWNSDYRWGREVRLPRDFDFTLLDGGRRDLNEWKRLGLRDAFDNPLPDADIQARLIVPSGHQGPAFLAYDNFNVIMGWNRSEFYAIAVGHLADRIAGAGDLNTPPPEDAPALARDEVELLQSTLNAKGFDAGAADGIMGPATRAALRRYQASEGMVADGYPSLPVLLSLGIQPRSVES